MSRGRPYPNPWEARTAVRAHGPHLARPSSREWLREGGDVDKSFIRDRCEPGSPGDIRAPHGRTPNTPQGQALPGGRLTAVFSFLRSRG